MNKEEVECDHEFRDVSNHWFDWNTGEVMTTGRCWKCGLQKKIEFYMVKKNQKRGRLKLSKEELCKRCIHKQYCKMEKDACDKCGKIVSEFYPISSYGEGCSCYCKECYEKFRDQEAQDSWKCAISLIKTDKIHCIRCKSELTHKNLVDYEEDRISLKCQNCKLEFTIWHGEPYDGGYMDYLEEQEGREYSQRVKEWKARGEKGPRPETPEEGRLRQALIFKYGEY